jgi:hypothetical protein
MGPDRGFSEVLPQCIMSVSLNVYAGNKKQGLSSRCDTLPRLLSLFKGATKKQELAVPKGSCENRMSGELVANRSLLQNRTSVCSAMQFFFFFKKNPPKFASCENSKKKLGQPTACSPGLSTAYDGLRPLKREVVSLTEKVVHTFSFHPRD